MLNNKREEEEEGEKTANNNTSFQFLCYYSENKTIISTHSSACFQ